MGIATKHGKTVTVGGKTYHFASEEDAEGFRDCVESGGEPDTCAKKWRCILCDDGCADGDPLPPRERMR